MGGKGNQGAAGRYTVKSVTIMTGINENTLRAWETRHQAVTPERAPGGRRLYSRDDVDRIRAMMLLCDRGQAISSIARLPMSELIRRLNEPDESRLMDRARSPARDALPGLLEAVSAFRLQRFRHLLRVSLNHLGAVTFILEVVSPVMSGMGDMTANGGITIAQEHAASSIVKSVLFELLFSAPVQEDEPGDRERRPILFATMEGDHHDLGILCAAALSSLRGHRTVFIGGNTPPDSLILAARALDAGCVVLGAVEIPPSLLPHSREDYLLRLRAALPGRCRIVLGTSGPPVSAQIAGCGGISVIRSLAEFHEQYCAG